MNFLYTNILGFDNFYNPLPHLISKYDSFANIPHFNDKLPLLFRNKHLIFGIVFAIINVEVISMDGKIVFIASHYLYQPIRDALERIHTDCETIVAVYDNFDHISKVYNQYAPEAAAFLVTGPSAKRAIELGCNTGDKPIVSFQVGADALYRDILRMAVELPDQDLHRVAVDFLLPLNCGYSVADFLKIDELDSVEPMIQEWMDQAGVQAVGGAENAIIQRLLDLWQKKEIDLVLCQYSSIAPILDALDIPYRCPFLSDTHLKQLIQQVQARIELKQMQEKLPAIVEIVPEHAKRLTRDQMAQLRQQVRQFVRDNLIESVEQETDHTLLLITTMQVLKFMTENFSSCRLSAHLQNELDFQVAIGYGVGVTVPHAMSNVQSAVREAKLSGKSYVMDSSGNLIGPLDSYQRLVVSTNFPAEVGILSKRCKLSTMTLQKLIAHVRSTGSDKITTQELAQRFDITIRNANRILTNLCKGGVATPIYTRTSHSRGRPVQVYGLNFEV